MYSIFPDPDHSGGCLLVIGIICICVGLALLFNDYRRVNLYEQLRTTGEDTEAIISMVQPSGRRGHSCFANAVYYVNDVQYILTLDRYCTDYLNLHRGDRFPAKYNPKNPKDAIILDKRFKVTMEDSLWRAFFPILFGGAFIYESRKNTPVITKLS